VSDLGRGLFLAFEGPEGAGKSTQIAHLAARLRGHGRRVVTTREPGGTPAGDRIREVLLDPSLRIDPLPEFLLYASARAQHVREVIRPALEDGADVLCDRFAASSVAYQGYGRGLDPVWVAGVNDVATDHLVPDATLLLDLPVEVGLARIAARGATDRLERADRAFHRRVRDGFLRLAAETPGWTIVDAGAGEETVAERVWAAVRPVLAAHAAGAS
jgi:dTMP kinase